MVSGIVDTVNFLEDRLQGCKMARLFGSLVSFIHSVLPHLA